MNAHPFLALVALHGSRCVLSTAAKMMAYVHATVRYEYTVA